MNPMDEAAEALYEQTYEHADTVAFDQQEHDIVDEHRRSTRVVLAG